MKWLTRLTESLDRPPKERSGGLTIPTQRTMNVREIRLRDGVVTLRTGEVRCFLRLTGFPLHHRSPEAALVWLQGYARALNALPGNAVLICRSRPGGLDGPIRRLEAVATALPYTSGAALAKLANDQLAHARATHESGTTRRTDQYAALRSPRGDVPRLLAAAESVRTHLNDAGCSAELVTDRALAQALADDWRPEMPAGFDMEIAFPQDSNTILGTLKYAPRDTHVAPGPRSGA